MSCSQHVDAVGLYLTRISQKSSPYNYPAKPREIPLDLLPQSDFDVDLWFEALRRAFAAHCRVYSPDTWRQLLFCAAELWRREEAVRKQEGAA